MRDLAWRDNCMTGEQFYACVGIVGGRKFFQECWIVPEITEEIVVFKEGTGRQQRFIQMEETNEECPDGSYCVVEKKYDEQRRKNFFHVSRGWFKEK